MYNAQNPFTITKCNFIKNECTGNEKPIIICTDSVKYSNCSFIGNKGYYLFGQKPTIDNCYFNNNEVTKFVQNADDTFDSIEPFDSSLSHYAVEGCPLKYEDKIDTNDKHEEDQIDFDINNAVKKVYKSSLVEAISLYPVKK